MMMNTNDSPRSSLCFGGVVFAAALVGMLCYGALWNSATFQASSLTFKTSQSSEYLTFHGDNGFVGRADDDEKASSNASETVGSVCSALFSQHHGHVSSSPMHLWHTLLPHLIRSSHFPEDPGFDMERRVIELLQVIMPRLRHAVKALPQQPPARIYSLMTKVYRRLQHVKQLQQKEKQQMQTLSRHERREYDNSTNDESTMDEPPPLTVVVFGGSVVCGSVHCSSDIPSIDAFYDRDRRRCTWPRRLHVLLNNLLLRDDSGDHEPRTIRKEHTVVHVYNACVSATDTYIAEHLLRFDSLPLEFRYPDIIINGHSTNDAAAFFQNGGQLNQPHEFLYQDRLQSFVRTVMSHQRPNHLEGSACLADSGEPPLLLFLDDYVGNGHTNNARPELIGTMLNKQNLELLAPYYGFGLVSTADAVRPFILADVQEEWFSPKGWFIPERPGIMMRENHPGELMHHATAFFMTYFALEVATFTCAFEEWPGVSSQSGASALVLDANEEALLPLVQFQTGVPGFPNSLNGIRGPEPQYKRPRQPPRYALPPRLDAHLRLDQVGSIWQHDELQARSELQSQSSIHSNSTSKNNSNVTKSRYSALTGSDRQRFGTIDAQSNVDEAASSTNVCHTMQAAVKCPFPFIPRSSWDMSILMKYIAWHVKPWDGISIPSSNSQQTSKQPWVHTLDGGKGGWIPNESDPWKPLILDFDFTNSSSGDVTNIYLFYLKSYGEKWNQSQVEIIVFEPQSVMLDASIEANNIGASFSNQSIVGRSSIIGYHDKSFSVMFVERITLHKSVRHLRIQISLVAGKTFKLMGLSICNDLGS